MTTEELKALSPVVWVYIVLFGLGAGFALNFVVGIIREKKRQARYLPPKR